MDTTEEERLAWDAYLVALLRRSAPANMAIAEADVLLEERRKRFGAKPSAQWGSR